MVGDRKKNKKEEVELCVHYEHQALSYHEDQVFSGTYAISFSVVCKNVILIISPSQYVLGRLDNKLSTHTSICLPAESKQTQACFGYSLLMESTNSIGSLYYFV